ncbi:DUF1648 domain-containing protein [Brachybacterium paraconglomeratum]|uniref:DUF1648 domain-containing protein n=1 Tax=Brachybacterium paraconglomeratum TaxID=173362 RepID=UPI0031EA455B
MNTLLATSPRPARTYRTGTITWGLRALGVLGALGVTAWILARYPSLPDTVATHFDASGQADDWGPKWSILVLAGVMLLLSLGLAALSSRPRAFNYPLEITADNAQTVYREGERLMVWTLLGLVAIYAGIAWSTVLTGGAPLIAVGVVVMVAAVVIGIIRLVRAGR